MLSYVSLYMSRTCYSLTPDDDPLRVETCSAFFIFILIYIFKCWCVRRSYCLLPFNQDSQSPGPRFEPGTSRFINNSCLLVPSLTEWYVGTQQSLSIQIVRPVRPAFIHHDSANTNDNRDSPPLFHCLGPPGIQPRLGSIWLPSVPETEGTSERVSFLVGLWSQDSGEDVVSSTKHYVLLWWTHVTTNHINRETTWMLVEVCGLQTWLSWEVLNIKLQNKFRGK
jgi:hypothetical protein